MNDFYKKDDFLLNDQTFIERLDFNSNNNSGKIIDSLKINPSIFNDFKSTFQEEQKYYEELKVTRNPVYRYVSPLKKLCENWFLNDKELRNELTKSVECLVERFLDALRFKKFLFVVNPQEIIEIEKNIINVELFLEIILKEMNHNPKLTLELYDLMNKTSSNEPYLLDHSDNILASKKLMNYVDDKYLNPIQIKLKNIFYDKIPILNREELE